MLQKGLKNNLQDKPKQASWQVGWDTNVFSKIEKKTLDSRVDIHNISQENNQ